MLSKRQALTTGFLLVLMTLLLSSATTCAKVKLTYVNWLGMENHIAAEEKIIDLFNASHPDIEVTKAKVDWEQILVQIAAGTPPEVAALRGNRVGPMLRGVAEDLTEYLVRDRFDVSMLRPGIENYTREGRIYGLPWGAGGTMLIYNRNMFAEHGLSEPQRDWTWEDHFAYSRKLSRDLTGDGENDQFGHSFLYSPREATAEYIASFGGTLIDRSTGMSAFDRPEYIRGIEWIADMRARGLVTQAPSGELFAAGKTGMLSVWEGDDWTVRCPGFRLRAVIFPAGPLGSFTSYNTHSMSIVKGAKHPKQAWEFIKFYYSPEAQRVLGEYKAYPGTKEGIRSMVQSMKLTPGYQAQDLFGPVLEPAKPTNEPVEIPGYYTVLSDVAKVVNDVYAGRVAAEAALRGLVPRMNAILAETKQKAIESGY